MVENLQMCPCLVLRDWELLIKPGAQDGNYYRDSQYHRDSDYTMI